MADIGRPAKTYLQLVAEDKSHRTEEELNFRKEQENSVKSKLKIKCKFDKKMYPDGYKEFKRRLDILKAIDKDDAVYENAINRYAVLYQECLWLETDIFLCRQTVSEIRNSDADPLTKLDSIGKVEKRIMSFDKKLMEKRAAMLSIERENLMTISAALRAIPKTPQKTRVSKTDQYFD